MEMAAEVDSIRAVVLLTRAVEDTVVAVASLAMVAAVATSPILVVEVTSAMEGIVVVRTVTMVLLGVDMEPVVVAMDIPVVVLFSEAVTKDQGVVMPGMALAGTFRIRVLLVLVEIGIFSKGSRVLLVEIKEVGILVPIIITIEEIIRGGILVVEGLMRIGIGGMSRRVLCEAALMLISCSKRFR
jgi:hypothetical protein